VLIIYLILVQIAYDKLENSTGQKVEVFVDHQVELIEEFPRAEHGRYERDASSNKSDEM
jgi:hypothetical protein